MIIDKLQKIFNDVTGRTDITLERNTKIDNSIGVSSFIKIQLVCALEDEFEMEIPNVKLAGFKTVKDIVEYLQEKGVQ